MILCKVFAQLGNGLGPEKLLFPSVHNLTEQKYLMSAHSIKYTSGKIQKEPVVILEKQNCSIYYAHSNQVFRCFPCNGEILFC